jgi:hypothetical protein
MTLKLIVSGLVLFGAFFAGQKAALSAPQDEKEAAKQAEMMMKVAKSAIPGEQHKQLAKMAGKWNQEIKFGPTANAGTIEYKSIIDGRFVVGHCTSQMPGPDGKMMPFLGFQLLGYDNVTKQYQSVWVDSMGTGFWACSGPADASGKVVTLEGTMKDVITPEGRPFKFVVKHDGDDKRVIEMWDAMEAGKAPTLQGTITETRAK